VLAKIASLKLASNYVSQYPEKKFDFKVLICCGIFGKNDNFNEENSHVLPALVKKAIIAKRSAAKKIIIWGTGKPKREFLSSEEVAKISLFLMYINKNRFNKITKNKIYINVGSGIEYSIIKLTKIILKTINYKVEIKKDLSKPDGIKSKCLNIGNLKKLNWKFSTPFLKTLKKYIFENNKNYTFS
jgi:nucleoside-diphosphate-sugar epimerase